MSVIVLGSDTPIGLTVIRELGSRGVTVHAIGRGLRSIGAASRFASANHARPPGPLADWLPPMIAEIGASALLAISEDDLVALAALPAKIGDCQILTPRADLLAIALDKTATLERAAAIGIDVPRSWQPEATDDFAACAAALDYPVVLKWADPPAILTALGAYGITFEKAEFAPDAARLAAILHRYDRLGHWPLVQNYCTGYGFGQMLHMADGRATLRFQHRRLHEWPPEGGGSTLCAAVSLDEHRAQMARSEELLRSIGWEGPAMVEYRHDPATGRYWLMEINGRFWGSLPLASICGATFAWEQYRTRILGESSPLPAPRGDLRARYMLPDTKRLIRILARPGAIADPAFRVRPLRELIDFIADFFNWRTRYYILRLDDLGPTWRDLANMARKLIPVRRRETASRRAVERPSVSKI